MSYPASPLITFTGTGPAVDPTFLNNLQAGVNQLCLGTTSHAAVVVDGTGGVASTPGASHIVVSGTTPGIAAGTGAGTSPSLSLLAGSNDVRGQVRLTTGTAPAASTIFTITFATTWTTVPYVIVTPVNINAATAYANVNVNATAQTTSTWTLTANSSLSGSGIIYWWNYWVIG